MQSEIQDLGQLKRSISIEIPLEEIRPHYNSVLNKIRSAKVKGFRPGKFPKGWLEKRFKEFMQAEAFEKVIPEYYGKALDEKGINPATQATVDEINFEQGKPFSCKMSFEVKPTLQKPEYSRIQLEKEELVITDADIQEHISRMREENAEWLEAEAGNAAGNGDQVLVDINATINNVPYENGSVADAQIILGTEVNSKVKILLPHIEGMTVGETRTSPITLDQFYGEDEGKTVSFQITLKSLKNRKLPEVNAAFYEKFGKSSEEEFLKEIRHEIQHQKNFLILEKYYAAIKSQLPGLYADFDLPEILLKKKEEELLKQNKEDSNSEEAPALDISEAMDSYKKELRLSYILDSVATSESIEIDQNEVLQRFARMSWMFGSNPEQMIESPLGRNFYHITAQKVYEEQILKFVAEKVLGESLTHDHDHHSGAEAHSHE
ncbi:MAG: trigger factor [SAR324 cluster bacterium]|nr:trigger factor [SAR324 cluster bacterium]